MRNIPELEKSYTSVYLYKVSVKDDIKYFNNQYPFKYKFNWISVVAVLLAVSFFGLSAVSLFFLIPAVIVLIGGAVLSYRFINKRRTFKRDLWFGYRRARP